MKPFTKTMIATLIGIAIAPVHASVVRSDVDYQEFRNFAENKGKYQVGAVNIPVYSNDGTYLGTALPINVPMPDLSAVDTNRYISTLVGNQYMASVKHNTNTHFQGTTFGLSKSTNGKSPYVYVLADRNEHSSIDYTVPRLTKMVTEVAPAKVSELSPTDRTYLNTSRFSAFVRVGTGQQAIRNNDTNTVTVISNAYQYPTGGTAIKLSTLSSNLVNTVNGGGLNDASKSYGPLVSYGSKGDSGSGLFGYDTQKGEWVYVGSVAQYAGLGVSYNTYAMVRPDFISQTAQDDVGLTLNNTVSGKNYLWTSKASGVSTLGTSTVQIANGTDLNNGKDIVVNGQNTSITLANSVNQGAGGLYFNTNATVNSTSSSTMWLGSGVVVAKDKNVNWQVKNPENDRLSKLGEGTLTVNGTGVNKGSISVGDGKVVLNQNANSEGKQAFKEVEIVSGRGTVVLGSADQVSTDNIKFGYRGGKLDLNGNNVTFNTIAHTDKGATIANDSVGKASTLTIKGGDNSVFTYAGTFTDKGTLNVSYAPTTNKTLVLTGGMDINGTLSVNKGLMVLSGSAVEYADDIAKNAKVVVDTDWNNSNFASKTINISNATLDVSRNVSALTSNITATNGTVKLGFDNGNSSVCQHNSATNVSDCQITALSDAVVGSMPTMSVNGNVSLNNSNMTLSQSHLTGAVQADRNSSVNITKSGQWTLNGNSTIGNLNTYGTINLNPNDQFTKFNTLTVLGNVSGQGLFKFSTDLATLAGNKLIINGQVQGNHTISVKDSGKEPNLNNFTQANASQFELVKLTSAQTGKYSFKLEKGYIDAGAYRYTLTGGKLGSSTLEKAAKDAKLAEELKAQEAARLEAERKLAEEAAKAKAEADRLAKEKSEAERLAAEEKAKAEAEQARIAQEQAAKLAADAKRNKVIDKILTLIKPEYRDAIRVKLQSMKIPTSGLLYVSINKKYRIADELDNNEVGTTVQADVGEELVAVDTSELYAYDNPTEEVAVSVANNAKQADTISKYTNGILTATSVSQNLVTQGNDKLTQRIAGLDRQSNIVWANVEYGHTKGGSDDYRDYKLDRQYKEVGAKTNLTDNVMVGASLYENRAYGMLSDNVDLRSRVRQASAFAKYTFDNNLYVATDVGYGHIKNRLSTDGTEAVSKQNITRLGLTAGANLAWDNITFDPFVNIARYRISQDNYHLSGAEALIGKQYFTTYQFGADVGYKFNVDSVEVKPFFGASYTTGGKTQSVDVNGHQFNYRFNKATMMKVGVEMKAKNIEVGLTGSTTKGKWVKRDNAITLNVNYLW